MQISVLEFFIENCYSNEFKGKRVLEVGSKYVNGSVRPLIEKFLMPAEYIGVDIEKGKYVDIVITTELLEHVLNWRKVINNMKEVLKKDGYIYITTCSKGFPHHAYPYDFWRYEIEDMKEIFKDFEIIRLQKDPEVAEVFMKAKKPKNYIKPINLSEISLYSIIIGKRTKEIITTFPILRKMRLFFMIRSFSFKDKIKKMLILK